MSFPLVSVSVVLVSLQVMTRQFRAPNFRALWARWEGSGTLRGGNGPYGGGVHPRNPGPFQIDL